MLKKYVLAAGVLAASGFSAAAEFNHVSRPWLPWQKPYSNLVEACTKDNKTLAVSIGSRVSDTNAFIYDFVDVFRRAVGAIDADKFGSIEWDESFYREWHRPMWKGGLNIADYYRLAPPVLSYVGVVEGCPYDLKP